MGGSKVATIWEETRLAGWPNVQTRKLLPPRVAAHPERIPDQAEF